MLERIKTVQGLRDVNSDLYIKDPEVEIEIDREKAAFYGISVDQIRQELYNAFGNRQVATIYTAINDYQIILETRPEFQAPVKTWTPVISPGAAIFYDGGMFPWKGDLLVGGLSSMAIIRLTIGGTTVKGEERINMGRRIRDVMQAADGAILVVTDAKAGELLRLTPAKGSSR
jgi:Cu/Ag efflux pump CusA